MNGEWRGVCREGISTKEAQVVCRHLELPTYDYQCIVRDYRYTWILHICFYVSLNRGRNILLINFPCRIHAQLTKFVENQGKVINKWVEVSCNGTEVSLLDCERRTPSYCSSISSFLCPQGKPKYSIYHSVFVLLRTAIYWWNNIKIARFNYPVYYQ